VNKYHLCPVKNVGHVQMFLAEISSVSQGDSGLKPSLSTLFFV
jgi:hypothetical protein